MSAAPAPRFAYLGTSPFAATVLSVLADRGVAPALVVAPPDRPSGRGRRLAPPAVATRARELGLQLHQSADVNEPTTGAVLDAAGVELGMVCAFGQLIREPLLSELELLNVHPSLLPRWRGAAPIERAIIAGDERTGVAIIRLVAELDAGPVALLEAVDIGPDEDFGSLSARLAHVGGELAARAIRAAGAGELALRPQSVDGVTYADKIDPAERRLDPSRRAVELERLIRALTPHLGASLERAGGERLGIARARAVGDNHAGAGTLAAVDDALALGCGEGALLIDRVKPAGKREMPAADYLRGHGVPTPA